ncbi:hypothetical protein BT96DRAFT_762564, partial [Gymnopus androsaceus JB14]
SPASPTRSVSPINSSPVKNTPTKLRRFLEHAENNLGVKNATFHLSQLKNQGYGPDILDCVNDKDLTDLGIKPGDVKHLKRAAPGWYNGPEAKRTHTTPSVAAASEANPHPNRRRFEKRYHDGGRSSSFGESMRPLGDIEIPDPSFDWWYRSELTQSMLPVPQGYIP